MTVGYSIGFIWYPIGTGDFVYAFFSTICHHLEEGNWGKNYPLFMNKLYQDVLEWTDVDDAKKELKRIQEKLKKFSPSEVIWDIDDLSKHPPWGKNISPDISDLSNYFITSDGIDLITLTFVALDEAKSVEEHLKLESL